MQGLALKNVLLTVRGQKSKIVYREQGELLFTHFGLSGPLVLSASAHMRDFDRDRYTCSIDLKPALDEQTLDARLVRELSAGANRDMDNLLGALAPRLLVPVLLERAGIPGDKKAHDLTKGERRRLLELFKGFRVEVSGPRPIAEAIVTSGGVKVSEVDPKTMASKKVSGCFSPGRSWTWTPTPAASTCRSPGPPAGRRERARPTSQRPGNGDAQLTQVPGDHRRGVPLYDGPVPVCRQVCGQCGKAAPKRIKYRTACGGPQRRHKGRPPASVCSDWSSDPGPGSGRRHTAA